MEAFWSGKDAPSPDITSTFISLLRGTIIQIFQGGIFGLGVCQIYTAVHTLYLQLDVMIHSNVWNIWWCCQYFFSTNFKYLTFKLSRHLDVQFFGRISRYVYFTLQSNISPNKGSVPTIQHEKGGVAVKSNLWLDAQTLTVWKCTVHLLHTPNTTNTKTVTLPHSCETRNHVYLLEVL